MNEGRLSNEDVVALGEAIAETAALIDAATHRFLTQLREFDAADGWARAEALTCAHWLSWRVGMNLGAAREKVRVARRLAKLPLIDRALAAGEVSYSKVRAMTRVATADNEADLLNMARNTTAAQLERILSSDPAGAEAIGRGGANGPTTNGATSRVEQPTTGWCRSSSGCTRTRRRGS